LVDGRGKPGSTTIVIGIETNVMRVSNTKGWWDVIGITGKWSMEIDTRGTIGGEWRAWRMILWVPAFRT